MLTRLIRHLAAGRGDDFTFRPHNDDDIAFDAAPFGLYIHVPFCLSICPYCPYSRVTYDPELAGRYIDALVIEIDRRGRRLGRRRVTSLYVGGGTPTLLADRLGDVIEKLHERFEITGPRAIETTPADATLDRVAQVARLGFSHVSLGVQSLDVRFLAAMGRNYTPERAREAIDDLLGAGFGLVNIDLVFAFPGQTREDVLADLTDVMARRPGQITCYPLFTFPYTAVGRHLHLRKLRLPRGRQRRELYYAIHDHLAGHGYRRTSVWSFTRAESAPYSSVTRDTYLGFGPSAASYTGHDFCFNTFSVPEYIRTARERLPVALRMGVSDRLERLFWLYWRLYETTVPLADYSSLFASTLQRDFGILLGLLRSLGFVETSENDMMRLSRRGAHWVHLAQNHFALNYVSRLWPHCQADAWPGSIRI